MDLITSETTIEELEQMKNKNIYQIAKISGFSEEQSYALWSWSNKLPDPYAKEVISSILKRKRGEEENGNSRNKGLHKKEAVALALLEAPTVAEASRRTGISERTIYTWLKIPEFQGRGI